MRRRVPTLLFCSFGLFAQDPGGKNPPQHEPVTAPSLLKTVKPEFTEEAKAAQVQGMVFLRIIVDENGRASKIEVESPLGFGLDEKACEAVRQWEFRPGMKGGKPVPVWANVEVNFKLDGRRYDANMERRRAKANVALRKFNSATEAERTEAITTILALVEEDYAPAMFFASQWMELKLIPETEPGQAQRLLLESAGHGHPAARYEFGKRLIDGNGIPSDPRRGLKMVEAAAASGHAPAQFFMGSVYFAGKLLRPDFRKAESYFEACAARDLTACQDKLAEVRKLRPPA